MCTFLNWVSRRLGSALERRRETEQRNIRNMKYHEILYGKTKADRQRVSWIRCETINHYFEKDEERERCDDRETRAAIRHHHQSRDSESWRERCKEARERTPADEPRAENREQLIDGRTETMAGGGRGGKRERGSRGRGRWARGGRRQEARDERARESGRREFERSILFFSQFLKSNREILVNNVREFSFSLTLEFGVLSFCFWGDVGSLPNFAMVA